MNISNRIIKKLDENCDNDILKEFLVEIYKKEYEGLSKYKKQYENILEDCYKKVEQYDED